MSEETIGKRNSEELIKGLKVLVAEEGKDIAGVHGRVNFVFSNIFLIIEKPKRTKSTSLSTLTSYGHETTRPGNVVFIHSTGFDKAGKFCKFSTIGHQSRSISCMMGRKLLLVLE
jgi:hypothetical protein